MMKNLGIPICERFFLCLASLEKPKQNISCSISLFLTMIDLEVVLKELMDLADLRKTQVFCIHELSEIIMVNKDEDLVFPTLQVVMSSFKAFDNSRKLLIMGFLAYLS